MRHVPGVGIVDVAGRKVCSKREQDIRLARVYGAQGDNAAFTRLVIESKASRAVLTLAFQNGALSRRREGAE